MHNHIKDFFHKVITLTQVLIGNMHVHIKIIGCAYDESLNTTILFSCISLFLAWNPTRTTDFGLGLYAEYNINTESTCPHNNNVTDSCNPKPFQRGNRLYKSVDVRF